MACLIRIDDDREHYRSRILDGSGEWSHPSVRARAESMTVGPPIESLHFEEAPSVETVPGPRSRALRRKQQRIESSAVLYPVDIPIALAEGRGATVKDADGNLFLDFFAGIGVLNVGHSNPAVTEAVADQTGRLAHSLDFPTETRLELLEQLDSIAPGDLAGDNRVVFGGPTGSDAVEASIKLAKYNTGNHGMVAFRGSFHGETAGAFSLTADTKQKRPYTPLLPEVEHVEYPAPVRQGKTDEQAVEDSLEEVKTLLEGRYGGMANPAGVWVEAIQGEGGIVVPPDDFLPGLRDITEDNDVPLIVDEIQTGMGRTGQWFASEWTDVTPDIMPMAKALGGGLPLSATMYREDLDTWGPGGHTGTFRGSLPAMRAGIRTIEYVRDHDLLAHARAVGALLKERLHAIAETTPQLVDVRGKGLFVGAEFVDRTGEPDDELVTDIQTACYERGALVWTGGRAGNVIRLIPPLVMTREQAETGMEILASVIEEATADR
jgi:diaminobutyrate-2-oxoglutarate transaminase